MMRNVLLLLFFQGGVVSGQVFDLYKFPVEEDQIFLSEFIRANSIKEIRIETSVKPDNERIVNKGITGAYRFDRDGNQVSRTEFVSNGSYIDSLETTFTYQNGNLAIKRSFDAFGYYRNEYNYNSEGRVLRELFWREPPGKSNSPGYVVAEELSEYIEYPPVQRKRIVRNNQGLPNNQY